MPDPELLNASQVGNDLVAYQDLTVQVHPVFEHHCKTTELRRLERDN